ncbi:hypothetical protein ABPG72_008621 [Tetrahymena utriculariae]
MGDWRKKRQLTEDFRQDKYFDEEDDEQQQNNQNNNDDDDEEEEDELDAFMKGIEEQADKDIKETIQKKDNPDLQNLNTKRKAGERLDEDDNLDTYMDSIKKKLIKEADKMNPNKKSKKQKDKNDNSSDDDDDDDDEEDEDYNNQYDFLDSDGEVDFNKVKEMKKKNFQLLEQIDHSQIKYEAFTKNFYQEHPDITKLTDQQVEKIRKEFEIKVSGVRPPKPIVSFGHLGFDEELMRQITKLGFEKPTQIQCQALPCGLSGRDIVGVAKTGSGKTVSYLWPLLIHILDQRELEKNEGPIGLILAPTRELCQQVYTESKRYAKIYNISVGALLGGENKHEQWKMLKAGVEILIATPGRLMEMIQKKATNLRRCTYVVIDEADKMFSMGFEKQIRSIMQQIRPDRQTLLFTATLKKKIQNLVMDVLRNPVTIKIGGENQANEDIRQEPIIFKDSSFKDQWILNNLNLCLQKGKVLIFVNHISNCNKLSEFLKQRLYLEALVLHGDKIQSERTDIINKFKAAKNLLIATDVASRGLDIPEIKTVINYDLPQDTDTYIHRIGRTGRAGATDGTAYSLILMSESKFASDMLKVMEISGQPVPPNLEEVAMNDDQFKAQRLATKLGVDFAKGKDSSKLLKQALSRQRNTKHGLGYKQEDELSIKDQIKADVDQDIKKQKTSQVQAPPPQLFDLDQLLSQKDLLEQEEQKLLKEKEKAYQSQKIIKEYQEQLLQSGKITKEQFNIQAQLQQLQTNEKEMIYQQIQDQLQFVRIQIKQAQNQKSSITLNSSSSQQQLQQQNQPVQNQVPQRQSRESIIENFRDQMKKGMQQQFRSGFVSGGTLQKKN